MNSSQRTTVSAVYLLEDAVGTGSDCSMTMRAHHTQVLRCGAEGRCGWTWSASAPLAPGCLIRISLPAIESGQDVKACRREETAAIRRGPITFEQGETMMNILEMRSQVIGGGDFEKRTKSLEPQAARGRHNP
jgi:hypothetical protein